MVEYLQHSIFKVISDTAEELSITCFVIGGYVRDQIMNRPFKNDIDILVLGSGIGFAEKLGEKLKTKVYVYKRFGTAMLQYDNIQIEVVGARKESYRSDSRKPIVEDGTLKDDQSRRDFTINTLAISLNKKTLGELLDPFDGLKDIELRTIKTPLEPAKTFSDDPLRMMRAVRFATQLNFKIHIDAIEAISNNRERIKIVSKERIIDELNKIILS
ncbi:MAG TPA: tRNA nucleotidyltransferase, partial [Candidatus Sphingobacterium stercoripullorum]|nr:tRNA nucleotidyltransferase [Candidatus Sphingobacterium stercoripullorum]